MSSIENITDQNFEEVTNDGLVLVDFWAPWCGPCKMIAPVLDEIANEKGEAVKIVKLNVDDHPATPQKFAVRGIPTLMLFKNGENVETKVGAATKAQLTALIDKYL
ncbi:thioredoxin [Fangia hongkongensis]|uniref:thioredoxin n=1 Tax=Fangia hongkongensis TaxID=270495 RepID=UPI00037CC635|nr:thioredoxin [Fangia hongkongensis]MBK2124206.1 thioredoxin [Fangia hongkongensis]